MPLPTWTRHPTLLFDYYSTSISLIQIKSIFQLFLFSGSRYNQPAAGIQIKCSFFHQWFLPSFFSFNGFWTSQEVGYKLIILLYRQCQCPCSSAICTSCICRAWEPLFCLVVVLTVTMCNLPESFHFEQELSLNVFLPMARMQLGCPVLIQEIKERSWICYLTLTAIGVALPGSQGVLINSRSLACT